MESAVMDKADLRIPWLVSLRPEFRFVEREIRYAGYSARVRPSRFYTGVVDLRPLGIDAMLHYQYKFGKAKDHKLELFSTGRKTVWQLADIVAQIFDVDPWELSLMRIDFAADIADVPVHDVFAGLRVRFKRSSEERGELDYEIVGNRRIEYFRYGTSPNCVRIYDKRAECLARFPEIIRECRKQNKTQPTFEEAFGIALNSTLTRIERQAGGGRLPSEINQFRKLLHAADFNPFTNIDMVPNSFPLPDLKEYGVAGMTKLIGIHCLVQQFGLQQTKKLLNQDGNAHRHFAAYEEHVKRSALNALTSGRIYEAYRASTLLQLAQTPAMPEEFDAASIDSCYGP